MKSIVYMQTGAAASVLFSEESAIPPVTGHDLLVEVRAISVNPVDTKVRASAPPPSGQSRVLGWDVAGVVRCLYPQGRLGIIDDPTTLNVMLLKPKSISLHWEFMFTRSMFATEDRVAQHALLEQVANWVDHQTIQTTLASHFGKINVENLVKAHEALESHRTTGKIVLEGF